MKELANVILAFGIPALIASLVLDWWVKPKVTRKKGNE